MGTLSEIQHRKQIIHPFVIETIDLSGYTVDDFLWSGDWYLSGQKVMRAVDYLESAGPECPPIIKELLDRYSMETVSMFSSIDDYTHNGFDYHVDNYEICATNFVGRTEWCFDDNIKFELGVGDVLYIPKGVGHSVNVLSGERMSVSFIR